MLKKQEDPLIKAARRGDEAAFGELLEPLSRELHVYSYRMLGGFQDAEDALQEARLKAWRGLASYEPRASFRAWMYRIVTNTCLDMLRHAEAAPAAARSSGRLSSPARHAPTMRERHLVARAISRRAAAASADPEATVLLHESVRLALIRALQVLPPRQRAALILHDVLDWNASEVAAMLETTASRDQQRAPARTCHYRPAPMVPCGEAAGPARVSRRMEPKRSRASCARGRRATSTCSSRCWRKTPS